MPDLFLSYNRDDSLVMGILRDNLRRLGFNLWIDIEHLKPGTPEWEDAIEDAIQNCDCMLVICSPKAKQAKWVKSEIRVAEVHNKLIVPILVSGDESDAIPMRLSHLIYCDMRGRSDGGRGFRELVAILVESFGVDVPEYDLKSSQLGEIPAVQIINVLGHVEGHIIAVGGDVSGEINAAGGDIIQSSPSILPKLQSFPEAVIPEPEETTTAAQEGNTRSNPPLRLEGLTETETPPYHPEIDNSGLGRADVEINPRRPKSRRKIRQIVATSSFLLGVVALAAIGLLIITLIIANAAKLTAENITPEPSITNEVTDAFQVVNTPTDPPPNSTPTITPAPEQCIVTADEAVNVRTGPSIFHPLTSVLAAGATGIVTGRNDDSSWWQINSNGWVYYFYVTTSGSCSEVLLASYPAAPLTDTPPPTSIPLGYTGNPLTSNEQWTPIIQEFEGVEMALVPVGCFMMGSDIKGRSSERPEHQVCFEQPFWIDIYEVTNIRYGSYGFTNYSQNDNQPRNNVSWVDASTHCQTRGVRLPTEAEWEYSARGPSGLIYPWGNTFIGENLVYRSNSGSTTANVGSKPDGVSWVGAFDLSGNLWEFVSDWYGVYSNNAQTNPQGPADGGYKTIRGGSFIEVGFDDFQSFRRIYSSPEGGNFVGFRCARDWSPTD